MDPRQEYTRRLQERQQRVQQLDRRHYWVGNARLLAFFAFLGGLGLLVGKVVSSGGWLFVPLIACLVLAVYHQRLTRRWERARRAAQFYADGLDRLSHAWMGKGLSGVRYLDDQHPYQRDLDLFGSHSLFERLCLARTRPGEDRLARWLSEGASPEQLVERRRAVEELAPRLDLREELAALYAVRSTLSAPAITEWARQPLKLPSLPWRLLSGLLGLCGLATGAYWLVTFDFTPLLIMLAVQQAYLMGPGRPLEPLLRGLEPLRSDLHSLVLFLGRLEQESFQSPLGARLGAQLQPSAARTLHRLHDLIDTLDSRRNPLIGPLMFLSLATVQLGYEVESWKRRHGSKVESWFEALAELEALISLAAFTWENPEYVWPEWAPEGAGLKAANLGHPLLGPECVGNDLELGESRLWIVSGSNMAGKSSLLRAVGCNVVLAMAGAPVRAGFFRLEALRIGASIQLADSLAGGISRFYAEILRLRQVVEMAEGSPRLLFLLDEIMAGTNSHDRRIGAEAVLKRLVELGALGLVTTHDLALTLIADDLPGLARNVHFEDQLLDGKMSFDYHLRPGPVARSNALELMRAVGLEV